MAMALVTWLVLTVSVIIGWLSESPMLGVVCAMIGICLIWSLYLFYDRVKPRNY